MSGKKRPQAFQPGEVVVAGAGAAGLAAAVSAARRGAEVLLLEATGNVGGTVAQALIHTLAGLYDCRGEFINQGLPLELADRLARQDPPAQPRRTGRMWVLDVSPEVYQRTVQAWISEEPRITVLCQSTITRVETNNGTVGLIQFTSPQGTTTLEPRAVIDATGTAEVVRLIDRELVWDGPPRAAAGLIFSLRGVQAHRLRFPASAYVLSLLRRAVADRELSAECAFAWIDAGLREDEVYVKLTIPLPDDWRKREEQARILRRAEKTRAELVAFLRRLHLFARAEITRTGTLGIRDGGRIKGDYCLTESDVRSGRRFPDAACRCCWAIEYWDAQEGVTREYLPPDKYYEVPMSSLKVHRTDNLWAAGKCLSADYRAQASARVVGSCWAMGEAVGKAAAAYQGNVKA